MERLAREGGEASVGKVGRLAREGGEARVIGKVNRFKYAHAIAFWCLLYNWVNFSLDHYVTLYLDINSVFKNQGRWNKNL